MSLTRSELQAIAASVGERVGWDFSSVRFDRDPVPWDYVNVARKYLVPSHRVLDVGTGGAEVLISLSSHFGNSLAIDAYPVMIATAQKNLRDQAVVNVVLQLMRAESLGFAAGSFDVVLNRHAPTYVEEIGRVLRPQGLFISQQVGDRSTQNIYDAFGWGSLGEQWRTYESSRGLEPQDADTVCATFRALGYDVLDRRTYDVPFFYLDVESLVFTLKSAPLPEEFDTNRHYPVVREFIEENTTTRGIQTNEHRELLVLRKPVKG